MADLNVKASVDFTKDANCQGAWLMEVDEDPLTDDSQNTNTAALLAADNPDFKSASPPASYSYGYYDFDGVGDRCTVTDHASLDPAGDLSIVAWIRMNSFGDSNYGRIVNKSRTAFRDGYTFYVNNNPAGSPAGTKTLSSGIMDGSSTNSTTANNNIIDTGAWYHVAMVFDNIANTVTYYVFGVASGQSAQAGVPTANAETFLIGDRTSLDRQFDGDITQVAFFDRVLTADEIVSISDKGLRGEYISITESISLNLVINESLSDSISIAEDVSLNLVCYVDIVDSISIADTEEELIVRLDLSISDSISTAEDIERNLVCNLNIANSITIAEDISLSIPILYEAISDSITINENQNLPLLLLIEILDSFTIAEYQNLLIPILYGTTSDLISVADTEELLIDLGLSTYSSISVDDTYEDTFMMPVIYDFENITEKLSFRNISEELSFVLDEI